MPGDLWTLGPEEAKFLPLPQWLVLPTPRPQVHPGPCSPPSQPQHLCPWLALLQQPNPTTHPGAGPEQGGGGLAEAWLGQGEWRVCTLGGLGLFCLVICLWPHRLTLLRLESGDLAPSVPAACQQAPPRGDEEEYPAVKVYRRGAPGPVGSHLPGSFRPKVRPQSLCPPLPSLAWWRPGRGKRCSGTGCGTSLTPLRLCSLPALGAGVSVCELCPRPLPQATRDFILLTQSMSSCWLIRSKRQPTTVYPTVPGSVAGGRQDRPQRLAATEHSGTSGACLTGPVSSSVTCDHNSACLEWWP